MDQHAFPTDVLHADRVGPLQARLQFNEPGPHAVHRRRPRVNPRLERVPHLLQISLHIPINVGQRSRFRVELADPHHLEGH